MVAWPHSIVPPPFGDFLARRFIVDSFPLDVRRKIDFFIVEGFNPRSIFDWLQENIYPKWRKEDKSEFCVTRRTIYNYMKNRCPENLLVSDSYLKKARKRVDDDIDTMENIRESIGTLEGLIGKFDLKGNLSIKQIGSVRLLVNSLIEANLRYRELQVRLGLIEGEEKRETTENVLERLKREQEEKEKEALQKVVER